MSRYWDSLNIKSIDVFKSENVPQKGLQSCATIGLNKTNIGLIADGKKLCVEIIGVSDIQYMEWANLIATLAFDIMDMKRCFPGMVIKNAVHKYFPKNNMKHVLLTNPFLWEESMSIELDKEYITWLLVVPISDEEYLYLKENGVDALECLFEERQIDIFDLRRKSTL